MARFTPELAAAARLPGGSARDAQAPRAREIARVSLASAGLAERADLRRHAARLAHEAARHATAPLAERCALILSGLATACAEVAAAPLPVRISGTAARVSAAARHRSGALARRQ